MTRRIDQRGLDFSLTAENQGETGRGLHGSYGIDPRLAVDARYETGQRPRSAFVGFGADQSSSAEGPSDAMRRTGLGDCTSMPGSAVRLEVSKMNPSARFASLAAPIQTRSPAKARSSIGTSRTT